jgi:hypothetical protein
LQYHPYNLVQPLQWNDVQNEQGTTYGIAEVIPGDANHDGRVDFSDLLILAQYYGLNSRATWGEGDFNRDGAVGFDDLLILAQNCGLGTSAEAEVVSMVPEPVSLTALASVAIVLLRRSRRG